MRENHKTQKTFCSNSIATWTEKCGSLESRTRERKRRGGINWSWTTIQKQQKTGWVEDILNLTKQKQAQAQRGTNRWPKTCRPRGKWRGAANGTLPHCRFERLRYRGEDKKIYSSGAPNRKTEDKKPKQRKNLGRPHSTSWLIWKL